MKYEPPQEFGAVDRFQVKFPTITVDSEQPFPYGTKIRLALEVRVGGVSYKEVGDNELARVHSLKVEDVQVVSTYHPSDELDTVGGSAASTSLEEDADDEIVVPIRRTADTWPSHLSRTENG